MSLESGNIFKKWGHLWKAWIFMLNLDLCTTRDSFLNKWGHVFRTGVFEDSLLMFRLKFHPEKQQRVSKRPHPCWTVSCLLCFSAWCFCVSAFRLLEAPRLFVLSVGSVLTSLSFTAAHLFITKTANTNFTEASGSFSGRQRPAAAAQSDWFSRFCSVTLHQEFIWRFHHLSH